MAEQRLCRVGFTEDGKYFAIYIADYKLDKNGGLIKWVGRLAMQGQRRFKTQRQAWNWLKNII